MPQAGHGGRACQAMERYDEALADCTRAIDLDPSYAWAITSRGRTYQAMERYDEALADLNRAIEGRDGGLVQCPCPLGRAGSGGPSAADTS